jgi:hypothetical protein
MQKNLPGHRFFVESQFAIAGDFYIHARTMRTRQKGVYTGEIFFLNPILMTERHEGNPAHRRKKCHKTVHSVVILSTWSAMTSERKGCFIPALKNRVDVGQRSGSLLRANVSMSSEKTPGTRAPAPLSCQNVPSTTFFFKSPLA